MTILNWRLVSLVVYALKRKMITSPLYCLYIILFLFTFMLLQNYADASNYAFSFFFFLLKFFLTTST